MVIGSPSDHLAPLRSSNVHTVPSGLAWNDLQISGMESTSFGSRYMQSALSSRSPITLPVCVIRHMPPYWPISFITFSTSTSSGTGNRSSTGGILPCLTS